MKTSALRSDPETIKEWHRRSTKAAIERAREQAPRRPIGSRKGTPRRTRHPMPLPSADGAEVTLHEHAGAAVAFGPQAQLCRETMCAACYALECWSMRLPLRWEQLPERYHGQARTAPHHEPPMGRAVASDDDDTLPLCWGHHTGGGLIARHHHDDDPSVFYEAVGIDDWTAVRDEMRRRTAARKSLTDSPSVEGAIGTRSAAPADRVVDVTEPAGAGEDWAGPGRASTEETTP